MAEISYSVQGLVAKVEGKWLIWLVCRESLLYGACGYISWWI